MAECRAIRPFCTSCYSVSQSYEHGQEQEVGRGRPWHQRLAVSACQSALDTTSEQVQQLLVDGLQQVRGYQADGGPFPERLHLILLFARFSTDFLLLVRDWVALARREAASWPATRDLGLTDGTRQMLEDLLRLADQLTQEPEQATSGRAVTQGPPYGRAYPAVAGDITRPDVRRSGQGKNQQKISDSET